MKTQEKHNWKEKLNEVRCTYRYIQEKYGFCLPSFFVNRRLSTKRFDKKTIEGDNLLLDESANLDQRQYNAFIVWVPKIKAALESLELSIGRKTLESSLSYFTSLAAEYLRELFKNFEYPNFFAITHSPPSDKINKIIFNVFLKEFNKKTEKKPILSPAIREIIVSARNSIAKVGNILTAEIDAKNVWRKLNEPIFISKLGHCVKEI